MRFALGSMAIALLAGDAGAVAVAQLVKRPSSEAPAEVAPVVTSTPMDAGWFVCQLEHGGRPVTPVSAAITYLDAARDRDLTSRDVAGWFGDLDRSAVDVWKLETVQGERRVAFEVSRARWSKWDAAVAGKSGAAACSAVRGALVAHGVGRPRSSADDGLDDERVRSRHDFEMIYARRPGLYRRLEWAGTLDATLGEVEFALLQRWLETGR